MTNLHHDMRQMIRLIRAEDLADALGYAGVNTAFRDFCARSNIRPVRPGWYDPRHVRHRLDALQGILPAASAPAAPLSFVEQRRARNATL